jgi:uncharacterized repeat protein (TIGR03847 family)
LIGEIPATISQPYKEHFMPKIDLDLNPVDHITADAIGKPGERVFFLQAVSGMQTVTLLIEKLQIQSLATGVAEFFDELLRHYPDLPAFSENFEEERMHIQPPVMPLFRVGSLGLAYDAESDRAILVAHEILGAGQEPEDVSEIRFWCTRKQLADLANWGSEVTSRGRQICPLCGQPMDPAGHLCPKKNGHSH